MTCTEWTAELVECARREGRERQPGRELRAHLAACAHCRERWDAELMLNAHFRTVRRSAAAQESLRGDAQAERRENLLRDFRRIHRPRAMPSWTVGLAAAAAIVLAVLLGYMAGRPARKPAHPVRTQSAVLYQYRETLSMDASELSADDFIAVPYTPPLAPGEMVRVVHADLYPDALASMGVDVDPSWGDRLPADVVVGEDGLPRAVRISESNGQN